MPALYRVHSSIHLCQLWTGYITPYTCASSVQGTKLHTPLPALFSVHSAIHLYQLCTVYIDPHTHVPALYSLHSSLHLYQLFTLYEYSSIHLYQLCTMCIAQATCTIPVQCALYIDPYTHLPALCSVHIYIYQYQLCPAYIKLLTPVPALYSIHSFLHLYQPCTVKIDHNPVPTLYSVQSLHTLVPTLHSLVAPYTCTQRCTYRLVTTSRLKSPRQNTVNVLLKGEYEDYTWGYHRNPLDYPLPWVPTSISSVDPILNNR